MARIPVFVFKQDPSQVGNGVYQLTACFTALQVHVAYAISAHSENEYLCGVGQAKACDGSCQGHEGHIEDFSLPPGSDGYDKSKIVSVAEAFK